MNALIKKEIRLLLPAFIIACVLALNNLLVPASSDSWRRLVYLVPFVLCPVMAVALALNSFGAEVGTGNFSALLAQPVSRQKIWRIKTTILAVALLALLTLWLSTFYWAIARRSTPSMNGDQVRQWTESVLVFALVIFSGGLWSVLLLRQVAAGFWFTLLVPGLILMALWGILGDAHENQYENAAIITLAAYSVAGFFFARRLFLRAQDYHWSGGEITLPTIRGFEFQSLKKRTTRALRPRAALWLG